MSAFFVFGANLLLTLGHSLWQGLVIAGIAAIVVRVCGGHDANRRYAIWLAALTVLIACLPVTYLLVSESRSTGESEVTTAGDSQSGGQHHSAVNSVLLLPGGELPEGAAAGPLSSIEVAARAVPQEQLVVWLSAAYLLGVLLMLVRFFLSMFGSHRLGRDAIAVESPVILTSLENLAGEIGVRMVPALAWSNRIESPTVMGVFRPVILLPLSLMTELSPDEIAAVLAHELAHIRRHDLWINLFQRVVEALLFFHPAVWFFSRRLSAERECCCDAVASTRTLGRAKYSELLVRLAEVRSAMLSADHRQVTLAVTGDRQSQLRWRIARLLKLEEEMKMRVSQRTAISAVTGIVLAAVLFSASLPAESVADSVDDSAAADAATDVVVAEPARSVDQQLSEMESRLLGTWNRSRFLAVWTITFLADGTYRQDMLSPKGDPAFGTWHVENGSNLIICTAEGTDGTQQSSRSLIVSVDESKLVLATMPSSGPVRLTGQTKTRTYTRQVDRKSASDEAGPDWIPLGKVIERTVNDDNPQLGHFLIDFETGRLFSAPPALREGTTEPPKLFEKWIIPNGIDAMGETKSLVRGMMGFDIVAIPIRGTAEGLPDISDARLSAQFVDAVPGRPVTISGKGDLPATYLFQTREGSRGVLQITGFESDSRGVNIRYKLLSRPQRTSDQR